MFRALVLFAAGLCAFAQRPDPLPFKPSSEETATIRKQMDVLAAKIRDLRGKDAGLVAEVEIFHKAADFILRHPEEFLTKAYYDNTLKGLEAGLARAAEIQSGKPGWVTQKGRVARAYRSKVDGSVQPYAVIIPDGYDGQKPMRLDVVLHGKNARLNEVSFLADNEWGKPPVIQPDRIELIIYGRTNNSYRWSGETDVFEALQAVESHYKIDPNRIVLRGFSMGGAGTWHIGLHHPDRWAATEAGAGFTDTGVYAKIEGAPSHETRVWTIYDGYLYARNSVMVPTVGYGSIDDPQLRASQLVKEQLAKETLVPTDLRALFLVGPAIGHKFGPESKKESEAFIQKALVEGRKTPDRVRFVTYTTRYNHCYWLTVEGLDEHYQRAEVDARREGNKIVIDAKGVSRFSFAHAADVEIDGQTLKNVREIEKKNRKWSAASNSKQLRKRHGLQGPIDDAFMESFLVARPTGEPRDMSTYKLASARLDEFRANYDKYLRADIRLKDDKDVTDEDIRNNNLILFGDPASNKLIARVLAKMPMAWSAKSIRVGDKVMDGENQMLVAIYPNPLNPDKYVVLNSGHTFGAKEFKGTNALLYPRLGDWTVLNSSGATVAVGIFNEEWK